MSKLTSLVYVSSAVKNLSNDDLEHLLSRARGRNLEHNISGLLLFIGGNFMQCIEGEAHDVDYIFEMIMEDAMHAGLIKLLHEPIENRDFSNWAMAYCTKNKVVMAGDSNDQEILSGKLGALSYKETPARILLAHFWHRNSP
jgi:hypothetical protein